MLTDAHLWLITICDDVSKPIANSYISLNGSLLGKAIPCVIGKNGLANNSLADKPIELSNKKEGDLKTPEGIFQIVSLFSYQDDITTQYIPHFTITDSLLWVDDSDSYYYNLLIDSNVVPDTNYKSAERMLRTDGLYKYGMVTDYNYYNAVPKAGSAIFIHIWRNSHTGTEGCIAFDEATLLDIIKHLNQVQSASILITTLERYNNYYQAEYHLPIIG